MPSVRPPLPSEIELVPLQEQAMLPVPVQVSTLEVVPSEFSA